MTEDMECGHNNLYKTVDKQAASAAFFISAKYLKTEVLHGKNK